MALHDGTPRERYTESRDSQGKPAPGLNWSIVLTVALAVVLLIATLGFFYREERAVTNAPVGPPLSDQQPDTTAPVNPTPSK
jgi:hypothetical protein